MRATRPAKSAAIAAAIAVSTSLAAAASAGAVSVTVTGDDGRPLAINPSAPAALRNLRPQVVVTADPNTRYTVVVTDPAGRPAAPPVTCADAAQPATIQVPYRGNGTYNVAVTSYAAIDTGCAGPLGPAAGFPFTIAGKVALGRVGRFVLRDPGAAADKPLALPVDADPGAQSHEIRYKRDAKVRRNGALAGRSATAPFANGTATLRFSDPGLYTVVGRDAADGVQTPWSEPQRIRVVAPFDLSTIRYPDRSGPSFRVFCQIREGGWATGVVSVAIARGNGGFRPLGRARINGDGAFGAKFTARTAGTYRLRFTYRGNRFVTPGVLTSRFTVGTAIIGT
ncbi:MAG TPA: hypothetical protein VLK58_14905 [Conexibacter sp.]|nr:hypothetical protein [Conexibacter sp.]